MEQSKFKRTIEEDELEAAAERSQNSSVRFFARLRAFFSLNFWLLKTMLNDCLEILIDCLTCCVKVADNTEPKPFEISKVCAKFIWNSNLWLQYIHQQLYIDETANDGAFFTRVEVQNQALAPTEHYHHAQIGGKIFFFKSKTTYLVA